MTATAREQLFKHFSGSIDTEGRVHTNIEHILSFTHIVASLAWDAGQERQYEELFGSIPYKKPGKESYMANEFDK